jgi:hypothetical protein
VVVLAELEIFHSREIAPTRRVALGSSQLPVEPPPGYGGILLGGVVAGFIGEIDPDLLPDLTRLTTQLEEGHRIPQPRLRYRFQVDRIGLLRSRFRLMGHGEELYFELEDHRGTPAQAVLGAVYAAGALDKPVRHVVFSTIRRAMGWGGPVGPELIGSLTGFGGNAVSLSAFENPVAWALAQLGFDADTPHVAGNGSRNEVQRRFREQLREAHPDHGGEADGAARRIADLTEARRILLGR